LVWFVATCRLGRTLVLRIAIAMRLTLMLSAPVRWLKSKRIPGRIAAAIVLFGALGASLGAAALIASPAMDWVSSAPTTIKTLEAKVRRIMVPFTALQRSADRMQAAAAPAAAGAPRRVELATAGIFARVSSDSVAA